MGPDGRYQVNESKVAYGRTVPEDEIDLDTGFLMMPDAIPRTKPTEPPGPGLFRQGLFLLNRNHLAPVQYPPVHLMLKKR